MCDFIYIYNLIKNLTFLNKLFDQNLVVLFDISSQCRGIENEVLNVVNKLSYNGIASGGITQFRD